MPYPHWCTAGQRADSLFSHSHTGSQHPHRLAIVLRALTAQQPASTQPHRASGAPDRGLPWLIRITHPRDAPSAFYAISHASSIHMHTRRPSPPPPLPEKSSDDGPFVSEDASRRGAASAEGVAKGAAARVGQQLVGGRTSELLGRYVCPPVHTEAAPTTQSRGGRGAGGGAV